MNIHYGSIAVDNEVTGAGRAYVEVTLTSADNGLIRMHTEDDGDSAVEILMTTSDAMDLIARLTEAVKAQLENN